MRPDRTRRARLLLVALADAAPAFRPSPSAARGGPLVLLLHALADVFTVHRSPVGGDTYRSRPARADAPDGRATYRQVFGIREFQGLWLAHVVSSIGDQLAQVALAVLVYDNTHSAVMTALAYALTYLPPIVGGPVLSVLADLLPRRRVMIVCDLLRAALVTLMAAGTMPFAALCALIFCTVLLGAPSTAARAALLFEVLPGDAYVVGTAANNIAHQATQMVGFLTGSAIILLAGTHGTLAIDALTFGASALILLARVRRRPAPGRAERTRSSLWNITRSGARLVLRDRTLRPLVYFGWLCGFYVLPEGLAAPYARTLGDSPVIVGLLMSAMPTGMVLGAFAYGLVRPDNRLRSMGWMAMLACAPLIGSGLRPPLWAVAALWLLSGMGSAYQIAANAAFVAAVPPTSRSQAFGLAQSGLLASQGLGILAGGALAQVLGPQPVVALSGAAGLLVATALARSWTRVIATTRRRPAAPAWPNAPAERHGWALGHLTGRGWGFESQAPYHSSGR